VAAQLPADALHRLQRRYSSLRICADGHGERVKNQILLCDAIAGRLAHNLLRNGKPLRSRRGNAVFIQRKRHHKSAVFLHQREHRIHAGLLAIDRIDHGLAVVAAQRSLHGAWIGSVDLQRQIDDRLQLADRLKQHFLFVNCYRRNIKFHASL